MLMDIRHTELDSHTPQALKDETAEAVTRHPSAPSKTSQRTCIVTREIHDKSDLFRFVVGKDGQLYFDLTQKLPGRGLYVTQNKETLQTALSKNLFAKAAKKNVAVPNDLIETITASVRRSALDHIGLSRRAGDLIISGENIKKYIKNNLIGCYITTSDEGSDLRRTLEKSIQNAPVITAFSVDELSALLKLENPVHLALKAGPLCKKFLNLIRLMNNLKD